MFKALLFDLDNTLVDYSSAHRQCISAMLEARRFPERERGAALAEFILENERGQRDRQEYSRWAAARFPQLFSSGDEFWKFYAPSLLACIRPEPSTQELLSALAPRFKFALVSNGSGPRQRAKLENANLIRFFPPDSILISGELGIRKPEARIFEAALKSTGCSAADALFVGDDPERDIGGAHTCGIATCWVRMDQADGSFPPSLPQPRWTIPALASLREILP